MQLHCGIKQKEPGPCEMCGNKALLLNAFLASFHNYQWVIQGNEVEVFSPWKLFSRQGQEGASRKKAKSRQCKCPAGSFPLLSVSWLLLFDGTQGSQLTQMQEKSASRTSCQSWLLVFGTSVGHVTAERASPLCPKGWRGCNRPICSVWRQSSVTCLQGSH